ncbi:MAG: bifunctional DNA-formamidopyrimidine glycosylase/DNA-(apurinic or apyrimidinic site) lyase [Candidatus Saccharicenans sp.]
MPELPEVETIVRGLNPLIRGKRVKNFTFLSSHLQTKQPNSALTPEAYLGQKIEKIWRRGKMIIFNFSGQKGLLIHLKMTGQLYLTSPDQPLDRHTHARMTFYQLGQELRFRDIRKFGFLNCLQIRDIEKKVRSELGPEPLEIELREFLSRLKKHDQKRIKGWLLDQKIIAGIGNIYSDEILFRARLNPERRAGSLSLAEAKRLFRSMRSILEKALKFRGSSINDYVDSTGRKGEFQKQHRVYGRKGEVCLRCHKARIEKKKICGRSSFFCPVCQA